MTVQKQDNRIRERFCFWLNVRDDADFMLADTITQLKQERAFTPIIRDGIRLVIDLRNGNLDVLLELFPWIEDKIIAKHRPDNGGNGELKRDIDQLKQLILSQGSAPMVARPNNNGGPKALDLAAGLVVKKDTSTDSGRNFLNSMLSLQQ